MRSTKSSISHSLQKSIRINDSRNQVRIGYEHAIEDGDWCHTAIGGSGITIEIGIGSTRVDDRELGVLGRLLGLLGGLLLCSLSDRHFVKDALFYPEECHILNAYTVPFICCMLMSLILSQRKSIELCTRSKRSSHTSVDFLLPSRLVS